ncbi:MAG: hypothetical protein JXB48_18735 [Candidatus Latescibacteria bacterium]|nr:hypothetical protein [Candidatus Latescibacterota bacterium]
MIKIQNDLKIKSVSIVPYRLDFRMNVVHSLASRSSTVNICVIIESEDGLKGYGECVPRSYVTGETPKSVMKSLENMITGFAARSFDSPGHIIDMIKNLRGTEEGIDNPAALCALELALLDLGGKYWNNTIIEMLGLTNSNRSLTYSLVVPLLPGKALEKFLDYALPYELKHAKIKVDADNPRKHVLNVKSLLGDDVEIRVDANCSWSRTDAKRFMREMAEIGVVSVEQPLPANDLEGTARLRTANMPLIILDEAVWTENDVKRIADIGAGDVINVRISKCGGLLGALKVVEAASEHDIEIQLGSHVGESCILSAAGAHLASGVSGFRWLEGCFGTHLLSSDLCEETYRFEHGGSFNLPEGPGLGVAVSESQLENNRLIFNEMVNA